MKTKQEVAISWAVLRDVRKLKLFCDWEPSQFALHFILVDPVERQIAATDSRMLIIIPLEQEDVRGTEPFLVDCRLLDSLIEVRDKMKHPFDKPNPIEASLVGGRVVLQFRCGDQVVRVEHELPHAKFPKYKSVIPVEEEFTFEIKVDARLLHKVASHAIANGFQDLEFQKLRLRFTNSEGVFSLTSFDDSCPPSPKSNYYLMPIGEH
jgi:hypothetical protein